MLAHQSIARAIVTELLPRRSSKTPRPDQPRRTPRHACRFVRPDHKPIPIFGSRTAVARTPSASKASPMEFLHIVHGHDEPAITRALGHEHFSESCMTHLSCGRRRVDIDTGNIDRSLVRQFQTVGVLAAPPPHRSPSPGCRADRPTRLRALAGSCRFVCRPTTCTARTSQPTCLPHGGA